MGVALSSASFSPHRSTKGLEPVAGSHDRLQKKHNQDILGMLAP